MRPLRAVVRRVQTLPMTSTASCDLSPGAGPPAGQDHPGSLSAHRPAQYAPAVRHLPGIRRLCGDDQLPGGDDLPAGGEKPHQWPGRQEKGSAGETRKRAPRDRTGKRLRSKSARHPTAALRKAAPQSGHPYPPQGIKIRRRHLIRPTSRRERAQPPTSASFLQNSPFTGTVGGRFLNGQAFGFCLVPPHTLSCNLAAKGKTRRSRGCAK